MDRLETAGHFLKTDEPQGSYQVEEIRSRNRGRLAALGTAPLEAVIREGTDPTHIPYLDSD